MRVNLLQFFRKTHLYVGIFTAPAILFFALTGTLQTFSLHETTKGSSYRPAQWIVVLAQIHKKQTAQVPQRKAPSPAAATAANAQKRADAVPPQPTAPQPQALATQASHNPLPLRIFFLIVGLSLFTSTASGIYLAWKYRRDRLIVAGLLLAGILAPLLLLQL